MSIQELSRLIVNTVLRVMEPHMFAVIPDADILAAYSAVARVLRQESTALAEPEDAA